MQDTRGFPVFLAFIQPLFSLQGISRRARYLEHVRRVI
jgi:hypothetical protein